MEKKKVFIKKSEELSEKLVDSMGFCLATDRILIDGLKVGYMYRENPDEEQDSGWRFFAGDEDEDYLDNPNNIGVYEVNTIAHYDKDIIPFLNAPYNTSFGRNEENIFEEEPFESEI